MWETVPALLSCVNALQFNIPLILRFMSFAASILRELSLLVRHLEKTRKPFKVWFPAVFENLGARASRPRICNGSWASASARRRGAGCRSSERRWCVPIGSRSAASQTDEILVGGKGSQHKDQLARALAFVLYKRGQFSRC
jgi:hypothetical protein